MTTKSIATLGTDSATAFANNNTGAITPAVLRAFITDVLDSVAHVGTLNVNTQTDDYTLVLADAGKLVTVNKASGVNLTVPTNASVAFPTGTRVDAVQLGAGQVTVVASGGVTVRTTETLKLKDQYSAASLVKIGTNEWVLIGNLEAA